MALSAKNRLPNRRQKFAVAAVEETAFGEYAGLTSFGGLESFVVQTSTVFSREGRENRFSCAFSHFSWSV